MKRGTILVTGGAGYIGSHTIIALLENTEYEIISADCFFNSSEKTFSQIREITGRKIRNYNTNLCDRKEAEKIFFENKWITGIIHFAAFRSVPESVAHPELYYKNNNESLRNILALMNENKVENLIFSSSCTVYGNNPQLPVNENSPWGKPESPYAETKQTGEKMIQGFSAKHPEIKCIALRYFNPIGAHPSGKIGESPINPPTNLAPLITRTASGKQKKLIVYGNDYNTRDGSCIRDYVHVSDIAAAHVLALDCLIEGKNKANYDVFNLGTGRGVSVLEAIAAFEKVSGKKLNYVIGNRREGDAEAIYSDIEKARTVLGWEPRYTIEQMMESAWKWQLSCDGISPL